MCGVTALIAWDKELPLSALQAATKLVAHRGPDDEGYALFRTGHRPTLIGGVDTPSAVYGAPFPYCDIRPTVNLDHGYQVLLGHRRLSILDLSPAGHQPMCSAEGRYWIVYNGEVYNYLELRRELESLGCRFHSQSDTEVILKAYENWGVSCLHRFNGMFAWVLYDRKEHRVWAVRDRFGVKPLYYWQSPEGYLALASEIKQFTVLPGWQATANRQRVFDYLTQGMTDHTDETLFAGVHQLRGGESLSLESNGSLHVHQWYELPQSRFSGTPHDAAQLFRHLMHDSVRLRLRSDVDVGFCLSGGLDSSSIVCLANQLLTQQGVNHRQKTFSACSHEPAYDEKAFIDVVNRHCGIESAYHTYPSLTHLLEETPLITWHQDEPFGSTSIYAQWRVFELVKQQNVKVMLDGQGADEQLAGYFIFFQHRLAELFFSLKWVQFFREAAQIRKRHGAVIQPGVKVFRKCLRYLRHLTAIGTRRKGVGYGEWLDLDRLAVQDSIPFGDSYQSVQDHSLQLLFYSSLPMLLRYEDRDSMAHSVESRTPFLDYRLVEFLASLPSSYKISNGITKRVLRDGLQGILPDTIRNRIDKLGFATPEQVWITQHSPDRFLKEIDRAIESAQGILKPKTRELVQQVIAGKKPFSFWIWRLINFGIWIERFRVTI